MSRLPNPNRRLQLQERQRQADGAGGFAESWMTLGTLWGALRPGYGRERAVAAGAVSSVRYRIYVRAAPEGAVSRPRAGQRLVEGGRVFDIEAVAEHGGDGLFLVLYAREEVAT